ncbi:MAG: hypothetical protein Q8N98_01115 [bacterium]|nr:hypothetical protein [bacterium]
MPEVNIIKNFAKCPDCGSEDKISEMGCAGMKATGKIPKEAFTSLRKEIISLEQPALAGVTVPCILIHYDVCGGCGMERCTRAEIFQAPVSAQPLPQGFRNFPGQKGQIR